MRPEDYDAKIPSKDEALAQGMVLKLDVDENGKLIVLGRYASKEEYEQDIERRLLAAARR